MSRLMKSRRKRNNTYIFILDARMTGASEVDPSTYQQQSSMKPAHFKILLNAIEHVLPLKGTRGHITPSRSGEYRMFDGSCIISAYRQGFAPGSTRTRRASVIENNGDESDVAIETPTKSTRSIKQSSASSSKIPPSRADRASASGSATKKRQMKVDGLVKPNLSREHRQRMEDGMDEGLIRTGTSPSKTSRSGALEVADDGAIRVLSSRNSRGSTNAIETPTKASSLRPTPTKAFDDAISRPSPSPTPSKSRKKPTTPAKSLASGERAELEAEIQAQKQEEILRVVQIPYEEYWDDMLLKWRDPETVQARERKLEQWKRDMLDKLSVAVES